MFQILKLTTANTKGLEISRFYKNLRYEHVHNKQSLQ